MTRPASKELQPGQRLRYLDGSVVTLDRRKTPGEDSLPGWWCREGGGLADVVIDGGEDWTLLATDTTHIVVGWSDEYDRSYVYEAAEGESEGTARLFEADVPTDLWHALCEAEVAWDKANKAVLAATDYEDGRAKKACDEWVGEETPGHSWYCVVLAESGSDDEWPIRDATVAHYQTPEEAHEFIAELPDEFWLLVSGRIVRIEKSRLSVGRGGFAAYSPSCDRCGWERNEHLESGEAT